MIDVSSNYYQFKVCVVGDSGVGKTCLLQRFTLDNFTTNHITTVGVDFMIKNVNIEEKDIKLQLWDKSGQEQYKAIISNYYKRSKGIIIVFDVTNKDSFENIGMWIKEIQEKGEANVCKILVGNKCDSEDRNVTTEDGQKVAKEYNLQYFETSAKTNYNVSEIFNYLSRELLNLIESSTKKD